MLNAATILTGSGRYVDFTNPQADQIAVIDICHGLARHPRFSGHTLHFAPAYTVAEHSVRCSWIAPPEFALHALLHDAAEAYTGDIPTPLKRLLQPTIGAIEDRLLAVIFNRFGLPPGIPPEVEHADLVMLATERRDLLPDGIEWQTLRGVTPLPAALRTPWHAEEAYERFSSRLFDLTKGQEMTP